MGRNTRLLIYSHDSFGLGHLRRCRRIAHHLVSRRKPLSVLILSGSPIIGSFDFRARVDFVRVPGVIKLRNGEYSSLSLHMDIREVLSLRGAIIRQTAEVFQPDVFLVDKEPLGLRGEISGTLDGLKRRGTRLVLGLRDVMDDPALLAEEWRRKNSMPALESLYDDVLVYGLPEVCEPLAGLDVPPPVARKITYTGYLRGGRPREGSAEVPERPFDEPYLLVTTGGGRDGDALIDWVLSAYEHAGSGLPAALVVLGPFMLPRSRAAFMRRVAALPNVEGLTFDAHVERLIVRAVGVVAMGGYNTFCEVLSLDKPALIVPRRKPRLEQYIRASNAEGLGLVRMLDGEHGRDPEAMARALAALPFQARPSRARVPGLLDGLSRINTLFGQWTEPAAVRVVAAARA
jgi:predicted glycosyltransferase